MPRQEPERRHGETVAAYLARRTGVAEANAAFEAATAALAAGDAGADGAQPVKAVVHVEEYPRWSFRYGVQLEGERQAQFDEFTSTKNLGVVAELRTPNLFGRALNSGVFWSHNAAASSMALVRNVGTLICCAKRVTASQS